MKIQILNNAKKKIVDGVAELGMGNERLKNRNSLIKLYTSPSVVSAILGNFFL